LRHTTPFIRLRALNVLDRIGEKARPALAEIRGAAMKDPNPAADYLTQMVGYVSKKFSRP